MNWTTIYITGRPGFHEAVLHELSQSDFPFMPGSPEKKSLALFWVDEAAKLRDMKEAIGSKTVFKYRLRFYNSIEEFENAEIKKPRTDFTREEQSMITRMRNWQRNKKKKVISA